MSTGFQLCVLAVEVHRPYRHGRTRTAPGAHDRRPIGNPNVCTHLILRCTREGHSLSGERRGRRIPSLARAPDSRPDVRLVSVPFMQGRQNMESVVDALSVRIHDLGRYLPDGMPDWLHDRVADGGTVALLLLLLALLVIGLWSIVTDVLKDEVKTWMRSGHNLALVISYLVTLIVAINFDFSWSVAPIMLFGAATLLGPPALRKRFISRAGLACQITVVVLTFAVQMHVESTRSAEYRYFVFLPFGRHSYVAPDELNQLTSDYLATHRSVFSDLTTVRIIPDSHHDPNLPPSQSDFVIVVPKIRELTRSHVCPALVVATTVDAQHPPALHLHLTVRGVAATGAALPEGGAPIDFETDQSVIRFLALRSALEIVQRMRAMQCDSVAGQPRATSHRPLLTAADEDTVKRHILTEYQKFLQEDDLKWQALAADVGTALQNGKTNDAYVAQLLAHYGAPPADPSQVQRQQCANYAKLGRTCDVSQP